MLVELPVCILILLLQSLVLPPESRLNESTHDGQKEYPQIVQCHMKSFLPTQHSPYLECQVLIPHRGITGILCLINESQPQQKLLQYHVVQCLIGLTLLIQGQR